MTKFFMEDLTKELAVRYNAFIDSQRDDVRFSVHTSQYGKPLIISKKQFGDWVLGNTYGYFRAYPYLTIGEVLKNVTIAKDDDGDNVILPILTIP